MGEQGVNQPGNRTQNCRKSANQPQHLLPNAHDARILTFKRIHSKPAHVLSRYEGSFRGPYLLSHEGTDTHIQLLNSARFCRLRWLEGAANATINRELARLRRALNL